MVNFSGKLMSQCMSQCLCIARLYAIQACACKATGMVPYVYKQKARKAPPVAKAYATRVMTPLQATADPA